MTTIAANRQMMVADSQGSRESGLIVSYSVEKVRNLGGDLVGCQGNDDAIGLFEEWYEGGCDPEHKPEIGDEYFGAIILTKDGRLLKSYPACIFVEHDEEFYALGSGEEIAMGAMAAGATPEQAVEIACRFNVWTGPPVVVKRLRD